MILKYFYRFIFSALIILIIASAHLTESELIARVHNLGVDIPMTPFTADMALMLKPNQRSEAYYKKNFIIRYKTIKSLGTIEGKDLGWYEFKAPFQWMSECRELTGSCNTAQYYLCRSLEDYTKKIIISWEALEVDQKIQSQNVGFGVEYRCPVKI